MVGKYLPTSPQRIYSRYYVLQMAFTPTFEVANDFLYALKRMME